MTCESCRSRWVGPVERVLTGGFFSKKICTKTSVLNLLAGCGLSGSAQGGAAWQGDRCRQCGSLLEVAPVSSVSGVVHRINQLTWVGCSLLPWPG